MKWDLIVVLCFFKKKKVIYAFIYLVLPGLSCGTWPFQVFLAACGLSAAAWDLGSMDQDRNLGHLQWSAESHPLTTQGCPFTVVLVCVSPVANDAEHLLCVCGLFVCLVWRNIYSGPLSIFELNFLLFSCRNSSWILNSYSLSYIWFSNIFFYSVCCLLLLIVSFNRQRF